MNPHTPPEWCLVAFAIIAVALTAGYFWHRVVTFAQTDQHPSAEDHHPRPLTPPNPDIWADLVRSRPLQEALTQMPPVLAVEVQEWLEGAS